MVNNQLLVYIGQQISLGVSRETIIANLKLQGWTDTDLNEAFLAVVPAPVATSLPNSSSVSGAVVTQNVNPIQAWFNNTAHTKSQKIPYIIVILFLLVVAGGGVYAYYSGVFVSLSSLTPKVINNARASNTSSYDTTFSVDFSEIKSVAGGLDQFFLGGVTSRQLSVTAKGLTDVSDPKNKKNSSLLTLSLGSLSLEIEIRYLNDTFYAKLNKAPVIGFFPTLASYENKWYSYSTKTADGEIVGNPLSTFSGVINANLTNKLTQEQKEHLYQMSRDAHFITQTAKLPFEIITGESSYHFSFDLDRKGISSYLQSLKEYINTIGKNDSSLSSFDPTSLTKGLEKLKDFKGEIWIGRSDKLLHKITFSFGFNPDEKKIDEQIKINIVSIWSDWNKPVIVTAPAESIPFADLVSASLGDARQKGKEASIKANLANMRAQAELFYDSHGNSYSGFCFSSELKTAKGHIESDGGGTNFFCKDRAQAYAVAAKFPQNTGNWCVDSTGSSKATTTLPSGTVCPVK